MNIDQVTFRYKRLTKKIKICLWLAAALLLYTIVGFFVVPQVTKYVLQKKLPAILHREVTVEKVYFNPFTLDMKIDALEIGKKGGKEQLASIEELEVNLQLISVIKRALVLSSIKISKPEIYISEDKKGVFNFQNIIEGGDKKKEKTGERPFYFSLNNIEISDGSVVFRDDTRGVIHTAKRINIGVPFISNLNTRIKIYTKPYFAAIINGAPLEFKGETRPFAEDHSTKLHIRLADLGLPHYLAYISDFINFKVDSGSLSTNLDLIFLVKEDGSQDMELDGNVTASSVSLSQKGNVFFKVRRINLAFAPSNIFKERISFSRISVDQPGLEVIRENTGRLNLENLIPKHKDEPQKEKGNKPEKKNETSLLDLRIARAELKGGSLHFKDFAAGNGTFETTVDSVRLILKDFGTLKKEPAQLELSFNTIRGEKFSLDGKVAANPVLADLKGSLAPLKLSAYAPYYQQFLIAGISKGSADVSSRIILHMDEKRGPQLKISDLHLKISDFELVKPLSAAQGSRLVYMPVMDLSGGTVDLSKKDFHITSVSINGLETDILIDKTGQVNLAQIVKTGGQEQKENAKKDEGRTFHFSLDRFSLDKGKCIFEDASGDKPVSLSLKNIGLSLDDIDSDPAKRAGFALSAGVGKKGSIKVKGSSDLDLNNFQAAVDISRLGLRQFQGYVSRFSNAVLYKGRLYFKGKIQMAAASPAKLKVSARGSSTLYGVSVLDPANRKPVFQWKRVDAKGILFENEPLKLHIKQIALNRLAGDVFYDKKGRLNLLTLIKKKETRDKKTEKRPETVGKSSQDIKINRVTFKECAVEIQDYSVKPHFLRSIKQINGEINGLSSQPHSKARLKIKGMADSSATMEVKGFVNPLAKSLFVDIHLKTDGIGMTRFTPYSARFLGYIIEKGKLSSQVHLVIQGGKISVDDKVFVDQFDFGHSVESKDATHLPVKLAIALLKDRHGQINLHVPVSGRLDDPEFSLGGAIVDVIINIFVKAATSPFSLLSAIAGGGEDLQEISFDPGISRLDDAAKKKLTDLARALKDRPGLKVELTGYYDPETDPKGLENLQFMRLLKKEKMKDLDNDEREKIESVDDVEIKQGEFNKYLKKAYKEAPFKKPRMFIGLLKKQPPDAMEKMLREHIKITKGDLENMALERGQAVQNFLVTEGGVDINRVFLVSPEHAEGIKEEKGSMVKLSLK